jgi:hypothetical protein
MFLNLTLVSGNTSPIIASSILNSVLAHLPCSRALHVKCRLLPKEYQRLAQNFAKLANILVIL